MSVEGRKTFVDDAGRIYGGLDMDAEPRETARMAEVVMKAYRSGAMDAQDGSRRSFRASFEKGHLVVKDNEGKPYGGMTPSLMFFAFPQKQAKPLLDIIETAYSRGVSDATPASRPGPAR